jgi:signal peptidase I
MDQQNIHSTPQMTPVVNGQTQPPASNKTSREGKKNIISTVLALVLAPLLAVFLTSYVFHSYEVFGPSMQPTLEQGDRLIVLKAPRTWAKITGKQFMPKRGQIVVFDKPDLLIGGEHGKQLIKRVIGLPGDRVVVAGGKITVYNNDHPEGYDVDKNTDYGDKIPETEGNDDRIIPEGEVYVSGDNRQNSLDSRSFGSIKTSYIVGTAEYRLFPFSKHRSF